jgi:regulator of protease activity HflC (stomatin/prohibitin superfamily)
MKSSAKARRVHRSTVASNFKKAPGMLAELTHFNNARRYVGALLIIGANLSSIGLGLIGAVYAPLNVYRYPNLIIPSAFALLGAALLITAGGFLSAGIVTYIRGRLLESDRLGTAQAENSVFAVPEWARSEWLRRRLTVAHVLLMPSAASLAIWPATLVVLLFGIVAAGGVIVGWFAPSKGVADPVLGQMLSGVLFVAAFPLLVLERSYAAIPVDMLPDAPQLNRLLRVPLTACLGLGISMVLRSLGFTWAIWIQSATGLLIAVIALELMLRSLAMFFIPFTPIERLRTVADSSVAGLLRFSVPNFRAFNTAVRQQFGIDLSRSWALAFIQRAMLPVLVGMGLMAWGVTGITVLSLNQRAVYERLGVPVAVFGPGLHFHLPWPMGVMRGVELGIIHDIPIARSPTENSMERSQPSAGVDQQQHLVDAEAPAPVSADRLWNASHPSEQSYLIASEASGQQSFQIADADLRIVYRIGPSDAAAINSAYRVADPETFIRAVAGQLLVRYFARYTLLDVLGQSRETFANEFRAALQEQLDRMSSGIEAIAVVIEAIHPPPGAADAYHNVQASEILAISQVSKEKAKAIQTLKSAEMNATAVRNSAVAAAAQLVNGANSESVLFDADRNAEQRDKEAFLLERWFERLVGALKGSEIIVVDHRLNGQNAPTIDLRSFDVGNRDVIPTPGKNDVIPPSGRNSEQEDDDHEFTAPNATPKSGSKP